MRATAEQYNACALRVLEAVERWLRAHANDEDPRWQGLALDPRLAISSDLAVALERFAANGSAVALGRAVLAVEPQATWLMFVAALDTARGRGWRK